MILVSSLVGARLRTPHHSSTPACLQKWLVARAEKIVHQNLPVGFENRFSREDTKIPHVRTNVL